MNEILRRTTPRSVLLCAALWLLATTAWADDFHVLHTYPSSAASPVGAPTFGGTTMYGTTTSGGGLVYSMSADGTGYQSLHTFNSVTEGTTSLSTMLLNNSVLYGTLEDQGPGGRGSVFAMNTDGSNFHVLHAFSGYPNDGAAPIGDLTIVNGKIYGTTDSGGTATSGLGGVVFSMNLDGTGFQIIRSFGQSSTDGNRLVGGLIVTGSTIFGTTHGGGTGDYGTLFSMNLDGANYHTLHAFTNIVVTNHDGGWPVGDLLQIGNRLYGTTNIGGTGTGDGTIYSINTDGTGYQILHSFSRTTDGQGPDAGVLLVGNTLVGTAQAGGSNGKGTIWSLNLDGTNFHTLYNFTGLNDSTPKSGIVSANGRLYGDTIGADFNHHGEIYTLTVPEPSGFLLAALTATAMMPLLRKRWRARRA